MICARCDKPIPRGEGMPVDKVSSSGGGLTLHVHRKLCPKPLTQTAPESVTGRIRGR